jgi:hypothetical protein
MTFMSHFTIKIINMRFLRCASLPDCGQCLELAGKAASMKSLVLKMLAPQSAGFTSATSDLPSVAVD